MACFKKPDRTYLVYMVDIWAIVHLLTLMLVCPVEFLGDSVVNPYAEVILTTVSVVRCTICRLSFDIPSYTSQINRCVDHTRYITFAFLLVRMRPAACQVVESYMFHPT